MIVTILVATCACTGDGEEPVPADRLTEALAGLVRPNLVLVVIDTLRADLMSAYGYPSDTTPEIRSWAERGVLFEQVRAQSSWTKISMASILTSLWPHTHGIRGAREGLAESALTVAEALQRAGYATYGVQANAWLDQSFGFHQGFDRYVFPTGKGAQGMPRSSIWPHADRLLAETHRLISSHEGDRPFFLYLHFMDVHAYAAPTSFQKFGDDTKGAYLAAMAWVDDSLHRLIDEIEEADRMQETILVLASDHGEAFGENGHHGHARNVLSAVVATPLVIRWPFPTQPIRVSQQVRNLDIAPTLLELAGVDIPAEFEGRSLVAMISGIGERTDRISYASLGEKIYADAAIQDAVTDGAWTFARNYDRNGVVIEELLYDRSVDPREDVNLANRERAESDRLRSLLEEARNAPRKAEILDTNIRIDPGIARRLRAMGYMQSSEP